MFIGKEKKNNNNENCANTINEQNQIVPYEIGVVL